MPDGPAQPVLTLAIEIANPGTGGPGGVAVGVVSRGHWHKFEHIRTEILVEVGRDRDDLIPAIERLLARSRVRLSEIRQIAVSVGPGGFTSTRVACATGAMLAEGLGVRTISVPSPFAGMTAWGRGGGKAPNRVAVLMATKGEQAWCAVMPTAPAEEAVAAVNAGRMMTAAEVLAAQPTVALADHHLPASIRDALTAAGVQIEPLRFRPEDTLFSAAFFEASDPSTLIPIYPREPEAVTLWRSRHGPSANPKG